MNHPPPAARSPRPAARAGLALIAVLAFLAPAPAPADIEKEIRITPETLTHQATRAGYAEHRFLVRNTGATDRTITLALPAGNMGNDTTHHLHRIRRTVRVPAGGRVTVSMLQPPLPLRSGTRGAVFVDGRRVPALDFPVNTKHIENLYSVYHRPAAEARILAALSGARALREPLEEAVESFSESSSRYARSALVTAELELEQWPTAWQAYSRFHGLVLTGAAMRRAPPAVRRAILGYVRTGGHLVIAGGEAAMVPAPWRRRPRTPDSDIEAYAVGFGHIWLATPESLQARRGRWNLFHRQWHRAYNTWMRQQSIRQAHESFPVVEDLGVPVRGMMVLMILFVILAGPVNLTLLSRMDRRLWALWTVPLMALLFSLTVFLYVSFAEGWTATRRTSAITLLDQTHHLATTIGRTGFYAPITPGGGLHYDAATELTPHLAFHTGRHGWQEGRGHGRTIDWTRGQWLASGWVSARVPAHFSIRKHERRRERLTVEVEADGRRVAVNGLGTDIRKLLVRDGDGGHYAAGPIPAGARRILEPVKAASVSFSLPPGAPPPRSSRPAPRQQGGWVLSDWFTSEWTDRPQEAARDPEPGMELHHPHFGLARLAPALGPHTYLAVVDRTPFIEPGLASARERPAPSLVYGLMSGGGDAD